MNKVTVTVPGKIMLAGEYAVLKSGRSLSCALDKKLTVTLKKSPNKGVHIYSNLWEKPYYSLFTSSCEDYKQLLLLDTVYNFYTNKSQGYTLEVSSDLDTKAGIGSSLSLIHI